LLDTDDRRLYLKELTPPFGYKLDRAIGTTFSLDLLSLLMAPLSLLFYEMENKEDLFKNPIALVDAIRKTSDHFAIFCQRGNIKIPKQKTYLYQYLEKIVNEVQPNDKNGVFHPKIWVMRFKSEDEPILYRFLCFSRNITFDNSWDTVLRLEGTYNDDRVNNYANNYPISDFLKTLPNLTKQEISPKTQEHIDVISEEILKVNFITPLYFDDEIEFIPSGIKNYKGINKFDEYSRIMTVSPFLSENIIKELFQNTSENNLLISKGETLDQIDPYVLKNINKNTDINILDEVAERPEEIDDSLDGELEIGYNDFSGLHAKLYIMEKGSNVKLLTGSANATISGLKGKNIEFMIGLTGKKDKIGIDTFLEGANKKASFIKLLKAYNITTDKEEEYELSRLEKRLNEARKEIVLSDFQVKVSKNEEENFNYIIIPSRKIFLDDIKITGYCYPISLEEIDKQRIDNLLKGKPLNFSVSMSRITSFVAFRLITKDNENNKATTSFVLNLPIDGIPKNRDKYILQNVINNTSKFIKYLLFLLADNDNKMAQLINIESRMRSSSNNRVDTISIPLLEELVNAYSREPSKIQDIKKIIDDLLETEQGKNVLPESFDKVWNPIWEAVNRGENKNE